MASTKAALSLVLSSMCILRPQGEVAVAEAGVVSMSVVASAIVSGPVSCWRVCKGGIEGRVDDNVGNGGGRESWRSLSCTGMC